MFVAICFLTVGCADDSYYGLTDGEINNIFSGKGTDGPARVTMIVGDYGRSGSVSKAGTGAFPDRGTWADKDASFRVYAFHKGTENYASSSLPYCLIDAGLDEPGNPGGRLAGFSEPEYSVFWPLSEDRYGTGLFYPEGKVPYDIFAYSTGGLEVKASDIRREAKTISFPLKIDGAADLMYSKAELTESQMDFTSTFGLSAQELESLPETCFSDWSARLGIVPVLSFKHALTRICFDMYPAEIGCNEVIVDKVEVMSRDSCIFTVVSSDDSRPIGVDFSADTKDTILQLTEEDGSKLDNMKYHTDYQGDFTEDILSRPHYRLGGSFLLPPEESYKFVFYIKRIQYPDVLATSHFTISPVKGGEFLAGSCYVVRVAVQNLNLVDFDIEVDPWGEEEPADSQD